MGYFANSTEAMDYEARWCRRCAHGDGEGGAGECAVWDAHLLRNYDECDVAVSPLHVLIPRTADGNERCRMFLDFGGVQLKLFPKERGDVLRP